MLPSRAMRHLTATVNRSALSSAALALALAMAAPACGGHAASSPASANGQKPASSLAQPTARPAQSAAPVTAPPPAARPLPTFPAGWPYAAGATPVTAQHGMVVTDSALATNVGASVLASGGNAADAAVATAFALAVVYPEAGNLGGGGFMTARVGGAASALDFRETAPAAATHDLFVGKDGKSSGLSKQGNLSSGVPGSVAGLWEIYQKLASKKKTWAELVGPALALARDGFPVDAELADTTHDRAEELSKYVGSAALFEPRGQPLQKGATWKNPDLAATLQRIADKGPDGFYDGPTAELIAAEMRAGKGLITRADLKAYRAKWRTPIEIDYRGHHLITMPPPSSSGVVLGMACHILEGWDLGQLAWHSPAHLTLTWEATRRAFAARNARLGDPDFVTNPTSDLLSPAWAASQRAEIKPDQKTPIEQIVGAARPQSPSGPHTTHFSVVDSDGNAVAITTTLNWWFGSSVTVRGAGFLMNNEMDDFAIIPGAANGFGLVQGEPNAVAPGKRMLSSMSPTIVVDSSGHVELVLGAAGGPTILTAVLQELSNVVDFGMDVTTAVNAPRFHAQDQPDVVMTETHGLADDTAAALAKIGWTFKERPHIADAPAIGWDGARWIGAPEPRRIGGSAVGW